MRILFLTRKYPPSIGGMETFSYNLITNFKRINRETFVITNKKGNKYLFFFLPSSFFKALFLIKKNKIKILHLGDAFLAITGYFLKKLTGVKTAVTIHGLDIIYPNPIYQIIIPYFVKKTDKIICDSQATKKECLKRGILSEKCVVIPIGVDSKKFILKTSKIKLKDELARLLGIPVDNFKILITVGRLVKRKGHQWFVDEVMPKLGKNYIYLVSGEGPERENIEKTLQRKRLKNRVFLLGKTDFETLKILYNITDLFIMPNIKVKGDIEGFGIVALEAASCGLLVVASNLEGIKDAVKHQENGLLLEPYDNNGFAEIINRLLENDKERKEFGEKARKFTMKNYNWRRISRSYLKELTNILQ